MPFAPLDFFAPVIPAIRAPHFGRLDGLAVDARGTWRRLTPRGDTGLFTSGRDHPCPRAVITPLGKIFIHGTFRE